MPARLTFFFRDRPQRLVELDDQGSEVVVGRTAGCSVELDDDRLSRRHARLRAQAKGWLLEDLRSKNGTVVQGRRIDSVLLTDTAWISFGGCLARFEPVTRQQAVATTRERLARWQTSADLQHTLDPDLGLNELLRRLLSGVQRISETDRSFVLLRADDGDLTVAATRGLTLLDVRDPEFTGSVGAVQMALTEKRTVVLSNTAEDPRLGGRPSILAGSIQALVCVPLHDGKHSLGVLYADAQRTTRGIDELDVEILEALARHASLAISVVQLREATRALDADTLRRGEVLPEDDSEAIAGRRWQEVSAVHDVEGEAVR